jgi:hypothetical protein
VSGIYINDGVRFNGPVKGKKSIDELSKLIVEEFNGTEETKTL